MSTFALRVTLLITTVLCALVIVMPVVGRLLPPVQIVPIVIYNNPTIRLLDVNRHLLAARRTNPRVILDAAASPDQQQIAFSMSDGTRLHVYVGGLYDPDYQRVTSDDLGGYDPAWSPDNRQIAFVGLEPSNQRGIYTVAANGQSPIQMILKAGTYASPAWSPDGSRLIFAASRYRDLPDIFVVDSNCRLRCDRQTIQITNILVADTAPIWSPDSSKFAFLSDRNGDYEMYELNTDCLQGDKPKCTVQIPQRLRLQRPIVPFLIMWSLDGREIYFRAWDTDTNEPSLYAVRSDCPTLAEGCQPRIIYNLASVLRGKRG